MKRLFDKRFFRNNWVVPASALILTLSIGSFALAGTGTGDRYSSNSSSSTTSSTQLAVTSSSALPSTSFAPTSFAPTAQFPTTQFSTVGSAMPVTAAVTSDVGLEQAKENAILDLIREKMIPEDQVVFDQLRSTAAQEQAAITAAQMKLQATKAQITSLIDKYLGVPNGMSVGVVSGDGSTPTGVELRIPEQ